MNGNATTREVSMAELDRIAGGAPSQVSDHANMMNMLSTILQMAYDTQKAVIGNLRC